MPARIVTISDHVDCPTGFGVQHRHLAVALARAGLDVHSLGLWDTRPLAATPEGLTRYPGGQGPGDHRQAWPMYRALLRPDLVITLGDLETFAHLNDAPRRPFAWAHWLPLDAEPYPSTSHARMLRYGHLVLMSRFALELVRPHLEGRVPLHYIPHAVDTRVFRPLDDPLALRHKWSPRLGTRLRPGDFLLIARDTNQWRKQTPLLLEALAQLPSDVKLILHCRPLAHPDARGWDLPYAARHVYGVADRVLFTSRDTQHPSLAPAELAELDNLADLRVSASAGEGFGLGTLEAMACGTPTVTTDYTTARELLLGTTPPHQRSGPACLARAPSPAPPADSFGQAGELVRVAAWSLQQRRHVLRPMPDPADLAAKVRALRDDPGRLARYAVAGLRRVLASYTLKRLARAWTVLACRILDQRKLHAPPPPAAVPPRALTHAPPPKTHTRAEPPAGNCLGAIDGPGPAAPPAEDAERQTGERQPSQNRGPGSLTNTTTPLPSARPQ